NRASLEWSVQRPQKPIQHPRIENRVRNLVRLLGDQSPPDRVPLWPEVLTFIVEPLAVFVHRNAKRHGVQPGSDAPVELRSASIERDGVKAFGIASSRCPMRQQ